MDYTLYLYIALAVTFPVIAGVLVKTVKYVLVKALPETVIDYLQAMKTVMVKPLKNVA
jgi:hypothetical protein